MIGWALKLHIYVRDFRLFIDWICGPKLDLWADSCAQISTQTPIIAERKARVVATNIDLLFSYIELTKRKGIRSYVHFIINLLQTSSH